MRLNIIPASILLMTLLCAACSSGGSSGGGGGDTTPPVLKNLVVNFAPYDAATGRAGDFIFIAQPDKVFDEFGADSTDEQGNPKKLPTFEYKVDPESDLTSPIDGVISQVEYQDETADYSIVIRPTANSTWMVNIDHATNVTVVDGDTVTAGQIVGNPGPWDENFGRTELMVVDGATYYCPFDVFDDDLKDEYEGKVTRLMNDWEDFKGDDTIYDQSAMVEPGCNDSTLTD